MTLRRRIRRAGWCGVSQRSVAVAVALLSAGIGVRAAAAAGLTLDYTITCIPKRIQTAGLVLVHLEVTNRGTEAVSIRNSDLRGAIEQMGISRDGAEWYYPHGSSEPDYYRSSPLAPDQAATVEEPFWVGRHGAALGRPLFPAPGTWFMRTGRDGYGYSNVVALEVVGAPAAEQNAMVLWSHPRLLTYARTELTGEPLGTAVPGNELLTKYPDSYYARVLRWLQASLRPNRSEPPEPAAPAAGDPTPPPAPKGARLAASFVQPNPVQCDEVDIDLRLSNEGDQPWAFRTAPDWPRDRSPVDGEVPAGQPCDLTLEFSTDGRRWWQAPLFAQVAENDVKPPADPPAHEVAIAKGEQRQWRIRLLAAPAAFGDERYGPAYAPDDPFIAGTPGPLHLRAILRHKRPDGDYGYLESPVATTNVQPAPPAEAEALALWRKEYRLWRWMAYPTRLEPYELRYIEDLELPRRYPQSRYTALIRNYWPERALLAAKPFGEDDRRLDRNLEAAHVTETPVAQVLAAMTKMGMVTLSVTPELAQAKLTLVGPYKPIRVWMKLIAEKVDGYWTAKGDGWELRRLPAK
mgnify:CR=1 FL=1